MFFSLFFFPRVSLPSPTEHESTKCTPHHSPTSQPIVYYLQPHFLTPLFYHLLIFIPSFFN